MKLKNSLSHSGKNKFVKTMEKVPWFYLLFPDFLWFSSNSPSPTDFPSLYKFCMLCLNMFLQTNKLGHIIKTNTKTKQLQKRSDFSGTLYRVGQIENKNTHQDWHLHWKLCSWDARIVHLLFCHWNEKFYSTVGRGFLTPLFNEDPYIIYSSF